jgi:hypothetical protein
VEFALLGLQVLVVFEVTIGNGMGDYGEWVERLRVIIINITGN